MDVKYRLVGPNGFTHEEYTYGALEEVARANGLDKEIDQLGYFWSFEEYWEDDKYIGEQLKLNDDWKVIWVQDRKK